VGLFGLFKHLKYMSRICDICGKGAKKAASRSKALNKTLRTQKVNLQKHESGKACTRCIRTEAKHAA